MRLISPALFKHQSVARDELKAAQQQRGRWVVCGLIVAPGDDLNRPYTFAAIATSWTKAKTVRQPKPSASPVRSPLMRDRP